jgi:hypothetical protein
VSWALDTLNIHMLIKLKYNGAGHVDQMLGNGHKMHTEILCGNLLEGNILDG